MGKILYAQTNFTAGEFSPQLEGRFDIAKYANGVKTLENMLIKSYGGTFRRPGTYFGGACKYSDKNTRVVDFNFSTTQAYILEIGHEYIRFWKDSGQITKSSPTAWTGTHGYVVGDFVTESSHSYYCIVAHTSGTFATDLAAGKWVLQEVYEIPTPYDEDDVFSLKFAQSADTLYIVHPGYAPRKLERSAHDSWTLTEITFIKGPYRPKTTAEEAITLDPSGTTGSITVVASASLFTADDVGNHVWMFKTGTFKITAYTNPTTVTATVVDNLPDHTASTDWAGASWSPRHGYPTDVSFYEQRLCFVASLTQPQTLWGSVTDDYENMETGSDDSDAIVYTIADNLVNSIRWIMAHKTISLGTVGGNFNASSGSAAEPLSPTNVQIKKETTYGASTLSPRMIGNYLYYLQKNGRTLREYAYDFNTDAYQALDMTLLSEHITESGIVDMAYQETPDNILWCVRADGQIATLTRQIDQQVIGWSRQVTDGLFKSVAVISNGEEDQVWVVVDRTVGGATVKYIEYFMPFDFGDQDDAFFVDCGLTYEGAATDSINGMDHLEGEELVMLAQGSVHPERTVTSGVITLKDEYTKVHLGLPFTSIIKTLRVEGGSQLGTSQGLMKKIFTLWIRFYRSLGCKFGLDTDLEELTFRNSYDHMGSPPALFTGTKERNFNQGYDQDGQITITQDKPLPMNILCLIYKADISD